MLIAGICIISVAGSLVYHSCVFVIMSHEDPLMDFQAGAVAWHAVEIVDATHVSTVTWSRRHHGSSLDHRPCVICIGPAALREISQRPHDDASRISFTPFAYAHTRLEL